MGFVRRLIRASNLLRALNLLGYAVNVCESQRHYGQLCRIVVSLLSSPLLNYKTPAQVYLN